MTSALIIGLLAGVVVGGAISWAIVTATQHRRSGEALRVATEMTPESIEATGSLAVQHQDEAPETGRGAVRMSARGVMWQIPAAWKGGGGAAPWRHVESVARRGIALHIVWASATGRTTLQYRGQGAALLEGMARRHLTVPEWGTRTGSHDRARWDSHWSRRN